ncbi:Pkinase domain-containing protein/Ribonuc_2-5A domain-containing protein [Cephalotus follicularis]|uniref:non-specific serine/threonine protein kinase n=1 Tax=Cephalotus follicularis TaxID=3775 RepID=A0A1Q3CNA4_CEPFO|nr:Pkinase domain-containing protein/Ribonuc_2-5A domain-containing protein [Cephalotus follicularis]
MRRRRIGDLISVVIILLGFWCLIPINGENVESSPLLITRPAGRTLKSHATTTKKNSESKGKAKAALFATMDGRIHLMDGKSETIMWSLETGVPIYSSYHNDNANEKPSSSFFIECGHDWSLYAHHKHSATVKLPVTIEDFLRSTPYISEDGAVTLGSKTTTVFVLEANTGRLLRTYNSSDFPSDNEEGTALYSDGDGDKDVLKHPSSTTAQLQLHITRTDYALQCFSPNSKKVSWSMTVAKIKAALLCQDVGNQISWDTLDFPLACQSEVDVYRVRTHDDVMLPFTASPLMLPNFDRSSDDHPRIKMLPASTPGPMIPLQPKLDNLLHLHQNNDGEGLLSLPALESVDSEIDGVHQNNDSEGLLSLPALESVDYEIDGVHDVRMPHKIELSIAFEGPTALALFFFTVILVGCVIYRHALVAKAQVVLKGQPNNSNLKTTSSKRKKARKSGKNNGSIDQTDKHLYEKFLDLNKLVDGGVDGRRIGKLFVTSKEIAKGSDGTIVLEGIYEGRPVAVKRLVQSHHDVAFKEIQNLIASDRHPNIVRWYGVEYDEDFVYLSLERCTCSLDDLIQIYSDSSQKSVFGGNQASRDMIEYKLRLDLVKETMQHLNLWKANGHPSPILVKLMRDVVSGLLHLHELGIIHRDLKPQNVLIMKDGSMCAKLSDMGISKRLLGDMSSLGHHATGCGSSGWQAPEQLLHGRQTRAVDMFSLGCVLFFCITGGRHPFGDRLERDVNIVKNQMDLFLVESLNEAGDLISRLLNPDPELRPNALEVLHHPLFWSSETRLSFLRDTSDRVELEDREADSDFLKALESIAPKALGGKWDEKMEPAFITNIGHYRRYKYDSVRDLLRVMRNKLNHYRELPKQIQDLIGPVPEGFDGYFAGRFPRLLIEVFKVVCNYCKEEECLQRYFRSNVI